jgi:hypothetical protein
MLRGDRSAKPPHPYKPLGILAGPPPPSTSLLSLYQELGPSRHFPLAAGSRSLPAASDLHNFHMRSLNITTNHSIVIYISRRCRWTPHFAHSGKYQGSYASLNLCSPESHSQATAVPGRCPGTASHSKCHIS